MGSNLVFQLDNIEFEFTMRAFFAKIVEFIYNFAGKSVDMLYEYFAKNRFGLDDQVVRITNSISIILLIFMIFRLTIKLLNYIIDPESVFDKGVGFTSLIKRVVIGIVILVSINPMFNLLYKMNDDIIDNDALNSLIIGNEERGKIITENDEYYYYAIKSSYLCPDNYSVIARSKGDALAIQALLPFYSLNDPDDIQDSTLKKNLQEEISKGASGYCGWKFDSKEDIGSDVIITDSEETLKKIQNTRKAASITKKLFWLSPATGSLTSLVSNMLSQHADNLESETLGFSVTDIHTLMNAKIYLNSIDSTGNIVLRVASNIAGPLGMPIKAIMDAFRDSDAWFTVDFHYFWAVIFGIVLVLLVVSFCFDAVIRALSLFLYQVIAPVPIILYMSPVKKDNDMLGNWFKKVFTCWIGLFIRLAALDFVIMIITIVHNSTILDLGKNGFIVEIIVISGALMFAKKLPKLIEELIPGLKFDGLELNPFKRFKNEALGAQIIEGGVNRTVGATTGLAGGLVAGYFAGKEVGDIGRGLAMGAASGVNNGFKNKKWSFGNSMNQAYKNLTGNDMKNLTLSSVMLSRTAGSGEKVAEVKGYIGEAYNQRNKYLSDLNISEHMTAKIANDLMAKGINVNAGSYDKQLNDKNNKIKELTAKLNDPTEKPDFAVDNEKYQNVISAVENIKNNHDRIKTDYETANNRVSDIVNQIKEVERQRVAGNVNGIHMDNSYFDNKLKDLQTQKQLAENTAKNLKSSLDVSTANLENANKYKETVTNSFNEKYAELGEISRLQTEIDALTANENDIRKYEARIHDEEKLRNEISTIDKNIDVLKSEKSERERFYRIDESPQDDFEKARAAVEERKQKMNGNNSE